MPSAPPCYRIGCVSFLNSKPLIDGLESDPTVDLSLDVPSRLLDELAAGVTDLALCPVIDFQRSSVPLVLVPVGGIGCDGPTLTVRLFSRVPIDQITTVYADTDSHTSVALARVILHDLYGLSPTVIDYHAAASSSPPADMATLLLIGDKVINAAPPAQQYPHQLDLGEAWKKLTGLPFVFAVWMARAGTDLAELPEKLLNHYRHNRGRIDAIVAAHAPDRRWSLDLAKRYLTEYLRFDVGPHELAAIAQFWHRAHALGLIGGLRPMVTYPIRQPQRV